MSEPAIIPWPSAPASAMDANIHAVIDSMQRELVFMAQRLEHLKSMMADRQTFAPPMAVDVSALPPSSLEQVETIKRLVAGHFRVPFEAILGRSKEYHIAWPRHVAIWLCRELLPLSLKAVGRAFDRDHGSVMNSIRAVCARIDTEPRFRAEMSAVRKAAQEAIS